VLGIDGDEVIFDFSYSGLGEQLLDKIDPKHKEYELVECIGGGRCFDNDMAWDELYEPELWEAIKAIES